MESEDAVKNWYGGYHFGEAEEEKIPLVIPNMEIRGIFKRQIMDLFKEKVLKYGIACYKKRCQAALGDE